MGSSTVRYSKAMRESATKQKKFLATISVYGKHIKDDSICIQAAVDIAKAKELTQIAVGLLQRIPKKLRGEVRNAAD